MLSPSPPSIYGIPMKFEIMPYSWYKRREPTEQLNSLLDFEVLGFEKIDGHSCVIKAYFDDGVRTLSARVVESAIYTIGGPKVISHWAVQGIDPHGISVVLKLIE